MYHLREKASRCPDRCRKAPAGHVNAGWRYERQTKWITVNFLKHKVSILIMHFISKGSFREIIFKIFTVIRVNLASLTFEVFKFHKLHFSVFFYVKLITIYMYHLSQSPLIKSMIQCVNYKFTSCVINRD